MLNFYDFEVFEYDWLVVIINPIEKTVTKIVNDAKALEKYFNDHDQEIWIGYNNRRYDQYIMKGILLGMNPKKINDWIIVDKKPGWQYSSLFNTINMINFDTMLRMDTGLKSLEAFAKAADGKATKIIIPSELQGLAGLATGITEAVKEANTFIGAASLPTAAASL